MTEKLLTEGEYRVGIAFNPGGHSEVDDVKSIAAELIDLIQEHGKDQRCTALAMTAIEEGAMWAVKSITKPDR